MMISSARLMTKSMYEAMVNLDCSVVIFEIAVCAEGDNSSVFVFRSLTSEFPTTINWAKNTMPMINVVTA
ncbi:hypothetical protein HNV12_01980 [Methanococcoides sp. SA1]|nr:hypothetical protein [Methanococcoides sp. SA1]